LGSFGIEEWWSNFKKFCVVFRLSSFALGSYNLNQLLPPSFINLKLESNFSPTQHIPTWNVSLLFEFNNLSLGEIFLAVQLIIKSSSNDSTLIIILSD